MNAISGTTAEGLMIYNSEVKSPMIYTQRGYNYQLITGNYSRTNAWTPISPGPRMIAWGIVDTTGGSLNDEISHTVNVNSGSSNFSVRWDGTSDRRWFELTVMNIDFDLDSLILIVTPIGNGSWDQTVAIGELPDGGTVKASIKFIDISRMVDKWPLNASRRRSKFSFVLYSLKKVPF